MGVELLRDAAPRGTTGHCIPRTPLSIIIGARRERSCFVGRWTVGALGSLVIFRLFSHWDWRALKLSLPACRLDKPRKPCAILHPRSILVGDGRSVESRRIEYTFLGAGAQHRNTSSMSSGSTTSLFYRDLGTGRTVASRRQHDSRWSSNDKSERRCFSACRARGPLSGLEGGGNAVVSSSRCEIWARQGDSRHCFQWADVEPPRHFERYVRTREDLSESISPKTGRRIGARESRIQFDRTGRGWRVGM